MKLSAALIVKNEKACLEKCLKSLKGFDEIVVLDTGSTDNTYIIARNLADRVYSDYKWNDNFAEARNHVLGKVTGDWVLSIDADEEYEEERLVAINTTNHNEQLWIIKRINELDKIPW